MPKNTKLARIERLKEIKPGEQLQHLYQDADDDVRDRHVERMWNMLHNGEPIDAVFKENFQTYFRYLIGDERGVPVDLFDNVIVAREWIASNFGLLHVKPFNPDDFEYDEALQRFTHIARLRTRYATGTDADEYCYATSELNAALLTVVTVFRHLVTLFIIDVIDEHDD